MLAGVNGPPAVPDEENDEAGLTDRILASVVTRVACRVVFPMPVVALVKTTVSEYVPEFRRFALELTDAITVVDEPELSSPELAERVSQLLLVLAVQDIVPVP